MSLIKGQIVEGRIENLAFGGQGILRHEGKVIFVPFTSPQEYVQIEISTVKSSHAFGQLLQVLEPGPGRIAPRCPYFTKCGGCQLQHLHYDVQLEYKKQAVQDALVRIGGLVLPHPLEIAPAQPIWHYRRHVHLNLRPAQDGGLEAGYVGVDHTTLIPVSECSIFIDEVDSLLVQLQKILKQINAGPGRVSLFKLEQTGFLAYFHFEGAISNKCDKVFKRAIEQTEIKAICISTPRGKQWFGTAAMSLSLEGLTIEISPQAFIQNHPQQSLNIYRKIADILSSQPGGVIDAYCGIGISSLILAKAGHRVLGVEANLQAIKQAMDNALKNHVLEATFICAKTEEIIEELLKSGEYRFLLVNPPKTGLHQAAIEAILACEPKEILYVSCMPSTLARDLKKISFKYELVDCFAFDMFPQTAHVETLVHLKLK